MINKPLVLLILDGWGLAPPGPGNALSQAKIPNISRFCVTYPHTQLTASGVKVGLPGGEDGNTETGHLNIGAGRIVYQDLPRINMSIADGTFAQNHAFISAMEYAHQHNSNLHIMGLLSDSGVHASREHLYSLLELLKDKPVKNRVFLHLFTDGRDSPPNSAIRFIAETQSKLENLGVGQVATIMGRYYGMDRDKRWDRTQLAYEALTSEPKKAASDPLSAIERAYSDGKTDEFIEPVGITDQSGKIRPRIANHDAVIFYNFRIDRPRQLTRAFVLPDFESSIHPESFDPYTVKYSHKHHSDPPPAARPFVRKITLPNLFFVTMTEYERHLPCSVAYPPQPVRMPLGKIFSDLGQTQLRVAETEKERFVTYYFNGMREDPYVGEDRLIIPSPKVPTYDLQPEMSAYILTEKLLERLNLQTYSFVTVNFANADMVAHTGNIPAAIRAAEVVDECVGKIVTKVLSQNGTCVITADHGNVEEMLGPGGEVDTEHSTFPVPFVVIDQEFTSYPTTLPAGKLGDIAPSILAIKNIPIPSEMTGNNLLADYLRTRRN